MKIRCLGARGSIPVSGKEFLKYGGNTTCLEITSNSGNKIIIDSGSGIKSLGNEYTENKTKNINILFTHYHFDHIMGLPFFKPVFSKDFNINIFGPSYNDMSCYDILCSVIKPPAFPLNFSYLVKSSGIQINDIKEQEFKIEDFNIKTIPLSHPNGGLGYKIESDNKTFVFLTDNELDYKHKNACEYKDYVDFCKNADLLIHDSEFNEEEYVNTKTWGHSLYNSALKLALEAKVKKFGLFHHNQNRSDVELEKILNEINKNVNTEYPECFLTTQDFECKL